MKTRIVLVSLAASLLTYGAFAQAIENDDMYFSAKDRAKLKALQAAEMTASAKEVKRPTLKEEEEYINPTDSYSARNVNPEFAARSNAEIAQSDNEDYFVNDYKYNTANNLNNWNNNFNSWYGNSWYAPNYYGSSINSWNSPYYGYNDPYMSPWYNPAWSNNGWSTSFSYHYGNSWNYGWGGNYNYWNQPYCGGAWASSWGPTWGGYSGWYGYPRTIVVVERNAPVYGKRSSRSSSTAYRNQNYPTTNNNTGSGRGNLTTGRQASRTSYVNSSGRTSSTQEARPAQQQEYYNRSWRRVTQSATNTNDSNSSGNSSGRTSNNSFFNNSSNNSNSNWNSGNTSRSSYSGGNSPSRSSSGSSSSGGSRSGGSSGSRSSRSH